MSGFSVEVDFSEVTALAARLPDVQPTIVREAGAIVERTAAAGATRARRRVRHDTGANRRAIRHTTDRRPDRAEGRYGSTAPHAIVMEKGRRPGAKMPPSGVLLGWMRRHGIPAENEFLIRRAISRKGIEGDHVFEDTLKELVPMAEREVSDLGGRVRAILDGGTR